jgi:hypothetical protein
MGSATLLSFDVEKGEELVDALARAGLKVSWRSGPAWLSTGIGVSLFPHVNSTHSTSRTPMGCFTMRRQPQDSLRTTNLRS